MLYRKFGKTGEMVSILGLGCMRLPLRPGGVAANIDVEESTKLVRYAIDEGVNYIDEDFQAGRKGLEYAAKKGLGITIMEPLRGGRLAVNLPASAQAVFNRAGRQRTPAEWALSWIWNHPEVSLLISGMNSLEQVVENIASAGRATAGSFTETDGQVIGRVRDGFYQRPRVDCTACSYCMPCPSGVDIPGCFEASNNFHQTGMKADYWLLEPEQRASCCTECGICEENCPQSLPIPELLKEVKGILETGDNLKEYAGKSFRSLEG